MRDEILSLIKELGYTYNKARQSNLYTLNSGGYLHFNYINNIQHVYYKININGKLYISDVFIIKLKKDLRLKKINKITKKVRGKLNRVPIKIINK